MLIILLLLFELFFELTEFKFTYFALMWGLIDSIVELLALLLVQNAVVEHLMIWISGI